MTAPIPEPFKFDLVDSAGYGYVRVWMEREYLLRLAVFPILIKFICAVAVFAVGAQGDMLRTGLIMLPGMLAQGWVLAQFLRTLLMNERWPQQLPKERDDVAIAALVLRARGIVSSTLVFVLIHVISTVIVWGMLQLAPADPAAVEQSADVPDAMRILIIIPLIGFMLASIWAFRLAYLYIPYVVLMPARVYLARLGGFMTSVWMLGLFMVTMVPITVMAAMLANALLSIGGGGAEGADPSTIGQFLVMFISAVVEMVTALIGTTAMVYALRKVIPHAPDALKDIERD